MAAQAIETMRTTTDTQSPTSKVKTVANAKPQRDFTDKVANSTGLKDSSMIAVEGTSMKIDTKRNGAREAFKNDVDLLFEKNEKLPNQLMSLGGENKMSPTGKQAVENNINLKPTDTSNLYMIEPLNMLHRRNLDEYPLYSKDGSFTRAMEDPA